MTIEDQPSMIDFQVFVNKMEEFSSGKSYKITCTQLNTYHRNSQSPESTIELVEDVKGLSEMVSAPNEMNYEIDGFDSHKNPKTHWQMVRKDDLKLIPASKLPPNRNTSKCMLLLFKVKKAVSFVIDIL